MRIIAHRGVSSLAPENTMAAFLKCLEVGVDWFEFDVRMLLDNSLIVMHDPEPGRTCTGEGLFSEMTFLDVRRLDCGAWFGPEYRLERIPELMTVIELVNSTDLHANLELKSEDQDPERRRTLVETALENLRALKDPQRIVISSADLDLLFLVRELSPAARLEYVIDTPEEVEGLASYLTDAKELAAEGLNLNDENLTEEHIAAARGADLQVNVWTVNDFRRAEQLKNWNADGIFTDYPQQLAVLA